MVSVPRIRPPFDSAASQVEYWTIDLELHPSGMRTMDPDRYLRLRRLVESALDIDAVDRLAHLQRESADHDALLQDALDLLAHDRTGEGELTLTIPRGVRDLSGTRIDRYDVLEPIGEGGMGIVYLAAQSAPLRRQVALKVIKLGMDTREVITRFESERQALALMDHPNIARVFDAGATEAGRPYFVMEYIDGIPLTRYCREHSLDLRERLELFIQVCHGVQHAHQKGVIHRDLKPGNILVAEVGGRPVPRIIDFGVAKATGRHLVAQTFFTQVGHLIGTPEYMSPEQADPSQQDVDTRSDVYSLGVLLYELITGVLPIAREELLRAGYGGLVAVVREKVPARPSARLTTLASGEALAARDPASAPRTWARRIRGDLDWITMTALAKERERRYAAVADLAADVERHLQDEVVTAGPPSQVYRLRKFARRNRLGVAVAASLLAALVIVAVWQTIQSQIIARERDRAMASERLSLARAEIDRDATAAVAYALASLEIAPQAGARDVIRQAVVRGPLRHELPRGEGTGNPISCDVSPDGRLCAASWSRSDQPLASIYDLADGSYRLLSGPGQGEIVEVLFNGDGSYLIGNGQKFGAGIHVWRVGDREHVRHIAEIGAYDSSLMFRLDDPGRIMICANQVGERTVWFELDLATGVLTRRGQSRGRLLDAGEGQGPAIDPEARWILDYEAGRLYLQRVTDLDTDQAILVGEHEAAISCTAISRDAARAVSVDDEGAIRVWDLASRPPELLRTFQQEPGSYRVEFDQTGQRFFTSWVSGTVHVYDLATNPPRLPRRLLDRSHWAHDGAFLNDGSVVTSRNGMANPVAVWSTPSPLAWSLDTGGGQHRWRDAIVSADGELLVLWSGEGFLTGVPLIPGRKTHVGPLGRTDGWYRGGYARFRLDGAESRLLADNGMGKATLIELDAGTARDVPLFAPDQLMLEMSPSGRRAIFYYLDGTGTLRLVDLDDLAVVGTVAVGPEAWRDLQLVADDAVTVLWDDCLIRRDLASSAPPETLWTGDSSGGGRVVDGGRALVVRDSTFRVTFVDLPDGTERQLGRTPPGTLIITACNRDLGLVALGGWWDTVEVFGLDGRQHWQLPALGNGRALTRDLYFDPRGRWLICIHAEDYVAWSLPLDPLYSDLDAETFLTTARGLTNLRVVPDTGEASGFRITLMAGQAIH